MMNATKQTAPRAARSAERGFTLVEIMVVIVILGLLATMVARNVIGASDKAREDTALSNCKRIAEAVRSYRAMSGRMPEDLDELATKDDRGRSELEELPDDPWDNPFVLVLGDTSRDFEVISFGPDGSEGTEDDISSKSKKDD